MLWMLSGCHCYCLSSVLFGKTEEDKRRAQLEKCLALHWVLFGLLWNTDLRATFSSAFSTAKLFSLFEAQNMVNSSIEILSME